MPKVIDGQFTARLEGDFVVFLIGMRINKPWKVGLWWPVASAMPKMLKELREAGPETGFLGSTSAGFGTIVQYWRSFQHLEAYARSRDHRHWPAWVAFNKRIKGARGDVGIWHETYKVRAGEYECVYSGMPPAGLANASELVPIGREGQSAARDRLAGDLK